MSVEHITGDLLEFPAGINVIAHGCNCQRVMGSGIAKAIRDKFPRAYEAYMGSDMVLGTFSVAHMEDGKNIVNLLAQENYGTDGHRYVNYESLYSALETLKLALENAMTEGRGPYVLGLPHKLSSERAGGDFRIVLAMIETLFSDSPVRCVIVKLP